MRLLAAASVLLAIGLPFAAGYAWFWEVQQNQCTGPKADKGLKSALSKEAGRPVISIRYSDLDGSEVSIDGALNCSGMLDLSFGGGDGIKIMAAYDVTPFGLKLGGHERVSPPPAVPPSSTSR